MYVGSVSFVDNVPTSVPVKIFYDTGATQTLESKHALHFDTSSATGEYVTVQTSGPAESGCISVHLHHVILVSHIVSGSDVVGVMNTRPVEGVSVLLGNDLPRGKVIAEPDVVMGPVKSAETDKIEEEVSSRIPSCGVTQARASKMAKHTRASIKMDENQDEDGDPSIKIDDKDRDPSIKIEDQSVIDHDPLISIDHNIDKDQDGSLDTRIWRLRSDGNWRNRMKTQPGRRRRRESDHQVDRWNEDRWRRGTRIDEPRDNDACDDKDPHRDFCDHDRESRHDSDDHRVPTGRSDECHRMLERQDKEAKYRAEEESGKKVRKQQKVEAEKHETGVAIEHNRHEELDRMKEGQCVSHEREDHLKPETPDWP